MTAEERLAHIIDGVPITKIFEPYNWMERARRIKHTACAGVRPEGDKCLFLQIGDSADPHEQYILNQLAALNRRDLVDYLVQGGQVITVGNHWRGTQAASNS